MLRGADRRTLFSDDEDCLGFLTSLRRAKEASGFSLFAYCLMGNHVHLLLKEEREPIEIAMKRLTVSYVYHYNQKYDLLGHLFQDRFRSEPVTSDAYFMDVLRYICQNPVKAGLSQTPKAYRWLGCAWIRDDFQLTDSIREFTQLSEEDLISFIDGDCEKEHLEETDSRRITDHEAIRRLCAACNCQHAQEIEGWPPDKKAEAVRKALGERISVRQLSRITGISKAVIERIAGKRRNS